MSGCSVEAISFHKRLQFLFTKGCNFFSQKAAVFCFVNLQSQIGLIIEVIDTCEAVIGVERMLACMIDIHA